MYLIATAFVYAEQNSVPLATGSPAWVKGKFGKGLSLDGIQDFVDFGHNTSLNLSKAMTIAFWVNPNGWAHSTVLIGKPGCFTFRKRENQGGMYFWAKFSGELQLLA